MDDEQPVVVPDDPGFVPEPVPDNIADTDINGLEPLQTDETAPVEEVNDETEQDQAEEPVEEAPEQTEEAVAPPTEEPEPTEAMTGAERRLAEKAQRDYIKEERAKIREYESTSDTSDLEERLKIMEAKQYVDTIERNRSAVTQDVARAQEIPFFKTGTEQSNLLFNQALENYATAYGVTDPDTGEWLAAQDRNGNDVPLLPYLQQQAAIYEQAVATAKQDVQKSEAKMRAKAVNPSNTGKARSSGNELDDLLERIGDTPLW